VDPPVKVHSALGPDLLESVYEAVLAKESERRGLSVVGQVAVPVEYEGMEFDEGFQADIVELWHGALSPLSSTDGF